MTPGSPGRTALILLAALMAVVLALGAMVYAGIRAIEDTRESLRRTYSILASLDELGDALSAVETTTLRFLLSRGESEPPPLAALRSRIAASLEAMKRDATDPGQAERTAALERLVATRFDQIARRMATRPPGAPTLEGPETRGRIDALRGEMMAFERQQVEIREAHFTTRTLWAVGLAVMVLVLAVAAIAAAAFYGFLLHNRRLQQLADSIPGLVSYLDRNMRYRFVNRTYADWFDIDPASLLGKTPRLIADEDAAARFEHYLRRALAGEVVTYEIERPFPRTDRRLIRGHFVPDYDRSGRVRGVFSLTLDVEIEDANRRVLEGARAAAMAESRAKSSFLATASHDLRQPLHALTLFLSALDRRVSGEETKSIVASMRASVRSMQDMFRTLLDISKIDAGVLVPAPQPFAIGDLIQRLATEFDGPAGLKGLALRHVATRLRVVSDPVLVESILRNLLSNAVKFTRQGKILIGAHRRGDRARIEVHDTGPGIAPEQHERVFQEFERVGDKSAAEGLGLGLAIVRRLAHLLETDVRLRSTVGRGTCFWLELPLAEGAAPALATSVEDRSASLVGRHILIVDDNFTLATALARELGDRGCMTVMAGDAAQALAAMGRSPTPEAAVLDYDLGQGLNGVALAVALERARGAAFPAIFVTGSTDPTVIAELTASGRPFLTKPVDAETLAAALAALLARGGATKP